MVDGDFVGKSLVSGAHDAVLTAAVMMDWTFEITTVTCALWLRGPQRQFSVWKLLMLKSFSSALKYAPAPRLFLSSYWGRKLVLEITGLFPSTNPPAEHPWRLTSYAYPSHHRIFKLQGDDGTSDCAAKSDYNTWGVGRSAEAIKRSWLKLSVSPRRARIFLATAKGMI